MRGGFTPRLKLGVRPTLQTSGALTPPPADVTAPTLSSPVGTQTGETTAQVGATTNEGNGTLNYVVTTSSTAPTALQVRTGLNHLGAVAAATGSQAIGSTGAKTFNVTGLTGYTNYYAHLTHRDTAGNSSAVVSSAQFTTAAGADVTAPTLSSPTDAANGSTGATLAVTTNEGNGTLYWFISSSGTPPSAANLKTGTGAIASGSQAVSGTGVQNASPTGLTASTAYYAHFLHRDAAGNDSAIVSGDGFTTTATAPTAPVLTKTSAAGVNPMSWSGSYLIDVDDVVRLSWTKNGGAATTETHTVTSDDVLAAADPEIGRNWTWPAFVTASASFVATDVVAVQERIERGGLNSAYSNTLTDTVAGAAARTFDSANKSTGALLSNGDLTLTGPYGGGSELFASRATSATTATGSFTLTRTVAGTHMIGFANASALFSLYGYTPGKNDSNAIAMAIGTWGYEIYYGTGTPQSNYGGLALTTSSKIKVERNATTGDIKFYYAIDGVTFVQAGTTISGQTLTAYYPYGAVVETASATADFTGL